MEHRYSDRLTADLNIVIYKQNLLVAMGVIKNIGSEGVFIESGFDDLALNQPLDIEIISSDKASRNNRFKAVVVHRTGAGFGAEIEGAAERIKLASLIGNRQERKWGERSGMQPRATTGTQAGLGYASL